ncbi:hypothetical protein HYE36_07035 [Mycoplasmopsis bovis]|nr:hypothetical protein [Mycoplasmopsis bovis]WHL49845.1 hypothetical protein HYE36_07035 [Mycoplasmopsis bovis]
MTKPKLDMGTTVTGALVNSKYKFILIFNIGDSRTYILDNSDQITQATVDHNYLNQLISDGISEQEAKKSTNRFSLTSALGPTKNTRLDISTILSNDYNRVKAIISTSDGTHNFTSRNVMENMALRFKNAQEWCNQIVDFALKNNSNDNASCVIVALK